MPTLKDYDWKKAAAQAAAPDDAVEKAFFDQAATFVANKAAPIMRDPYRLGFEIVQKNDDNTRMVGIFAFRINKDLYYAPAFFLNGEIKGTDLFYRHSSKTFVPLTEDWVKFLLEQKDGEVGRGISRDQRKLSPTDTQLRRIAAPPFTHLMGLKQASTELQSALDGWTVTHRSGEEEIDWVDFFKAATARPEMAPLLRQFLVEDGGLQAFGKIASAFETSEEFAEALMLSVKEADWLIPEFEAEFNAASERDARLKSASYARSFTGLPDTEPKLVIYGELPGHLVNRADEFFKVGHLIEDARDEKDVATVSTRQDMQSVSEPGYYKILLKDGTETKAFCARESDDRVCQNCDMGAVPMECGSAGGYYGNTEKSIQSNPPRPPRIVFVTEDGKTGVAHIVLGGQDLDDNGSLKQDGEKLKDTMESGSIYRIYDKQKGTLTETFYCAGKRKKNGLTVYDVCRYSHGSIRELKVNPDYDGMDVNNGIVGTPGQFIKIKGDSKKSTAGTPGGMDSQDYYVFDEERAYPGDHDNLRTWIEAYGENMKSATLIHRDGEYCLRTGPRRNSTWMPKMAMLIGLMGELHIRATDAENLIKDATAKGQFQFYLEPAVNKIAGTIRRLEDPQFQSYHDSNFGVGVEVPQRYAVPTETQVDQPPEHRIGDAYDPGQGHGPQEDTDQDGLPTDFILNSSPQQLAQLASSGQVPHVFEHGMVGSLLQTYDSSALLDKYLPKMEEALDCAGRILFLFYWKPGDFQSLYGVDDMGSLENKLLSNFKSFGDMVLDLTKRTRRKHQGTAPLPK